MSAFIMPQTGRVVRGFRIQQALGSGSYGVVYRATCDNDECAMKVSLDLKHSQNEIHCLQELYCSKVAPRIMFHEEIGSMTVIAMTLSGPNLAQLLGNTANRVFDRPVLQNICYKFICILEALHGYNIVHRDIKLNNFVVSKPTSPTAEVFLQIIDFGLSWQHKDANGNERADSVKKDFSKISHCSGNVAIGLEHTPKDDLVQTSYAMIVASGMSVRDIFSKPKEELLAWKTSLMRKPASVLPPQLNWLVPFLDAIAEQDDYDIDYDDLRAHIRDSVYESTPEGPLHLRLKEGKYLLE